MRVVATIVGRMLAAVFFAELAFNVMAADNPASYPSRPITILVGYPPGGATDIIARLVATKLSQSVGQPVIVENKPGAGSNIATEQVVRAQPDGYTLLVETIANATNMTVYKNVKYDSARDLAPIVQFMSSPSVLVVSPSLKATDLKSLIALAKAEPGKLTYASSGVGGSPHLAGELLELRAGVDMVHVPYKGATPAMVDVMSGHVSMGFMTSLGALEQIQAGKLRPIAVAYAKRLPELPDVPTMAEAGLENFEVSSWNGLAAPAGTPEPVIRKLNQEVNKILATPEAREQLRTLGAEPVGGTPQAFADYVNGEIRKWGEVIKAAGISLD
jgi:tripartite-type tricarboxylate transporter receptor subunit TctC